TTFAIIYTASGLSGSIFSLFLSNSIAVGASGAISGLLGCMLFLTYKFKRDIYEFDYKMLVIFTTISMIMSFATPLVDGWGHLGGFLAGILATFLLTVKST
ncbi:MAG: rhomboid family intramembrane serine protease, partial [Defluviitaleaceae bacterium]|nr:rhomboid family intramembrane serine protease [Defluviitaleaceae bacterium]